MGLAEQNNGCSRSHAYQTVAQYRNALDVQLAPPTDLQLNLLTQ